MRGNIYLAKINVSVESKVMNFYILMIYIKIITYTNF